MVGLAGAGFASIDGFAIEMDTHWHWLRHWLPWPLGELSCCKGRRDPVRKERTSAAGLRPRALWDHHQGSRNKINLMITWSCRVRLFFEVEHTSIRSLRRVALCSLRRQPEDTFVMCPSAALTSNAPWEKIGFWKQRSIWQHLAYWQPGQIWAM